MKKVGILVLALMASFGASAKPLTEAGLKKHAENVCGMRDTLDLKVPFDNKAPTEPLNTVNRGVVHAARDAAQVNKKVINGSLSDSQDIVAKQYSSDEKKYAAD
ncbi:hypothetical protein [Klebsiella pneumoniae]